MGAQLFGLALLSIMGIVFSLAGISSMAKRWRKRSWIEAQAVIHSIETKLIHDEGSYTADMVSYQYGASQYLGEVQTAANKYKLGQSLRLRYDPHEPSTHELNFRGELLLYLFFELIGFVALFLAYQLWSSM